jgi:hypothetical protein
MRKFLIAAFAATSIVLSGAGLKAEDKKDDKKDKEKDGIHGILIDANCGDGKPADKVKGHPAGCALKCADSGLGVYHEDKWIKFDEKGQKLAKDYLKEAEAKENKDKKDDDKEKKTTKVHVEGKLSDDGKTFAVKAIHPEGEKKDEKDKDKKKS